MTLYRLQQNNEADEHERALLFRLARNRAIDLLRRRRTRETFGQEVATGKVLAFRPAETRTPEDVLLDKERQHFATMALSQLSERHRDCLALRRMGRESVSNDEGYYTIPLLPPGEYRIAVKKDGFKPAIRSGVVLNVEQITRIDLTLEVGQVSEATEVVSTGAMIETETATLGNVRTQKAISELPINSRNFTMLVHLTAGSVPTSTQLSGAMPITAKR